MGYPQSAFRSLKNALSTGIIVLALFEVITVARGASAVSGQFLGDVENERVLAGRVDSETLIFTHVVFRHANRTPDATTFPKDPYRDFQYPPFGRGHLTLGGKKQAYENGQFLRKRYGKFLGDTLTPEIMSVKTTNFPRTQMTATLVSAGLWPPTKQQQWGEGLGKLFQPTYIESIDDLDFWGLMWYGNCPAYDREYKLFLETKQAKSMFSKYHDFRKELSKYTGTDIKLPVNGHVITQALLGQREYGLELPKWYTKTVEEKLYSFTTLYLETLGFTEKLQRFQAGLLLKDMLSAFSAAATNSMKPKGRKISLYCGHDCTLTGLLQALNVFEPKIPPFGAMILMELHSIPSAKNTKDKPKFTNELDKNPYAGNELNMEVLDLFGLSLFLRNSSFHEPYPLTMPKCSHLCPLDKFISLLASRIPQNMTTECRK